MQSEYFLFQFTLMLTSTVKDAIMAVIVQVDMACPPIFVNDGVQAIVPLRHAAHVGIQTKVVEQAMAMGTQCDPPVNIHTVISLSTFIISPCKVTIDTDIPKSSPTTPAVVVVNGETPYCQSMYRIGNKEGSLAPTQGQGNNIHVPMSQVV
jgi:hypothetical protein